MPLLLLHHTCDQEMALGCSSGPHNTVKLLAFYFLLHLMFCRNDIIRLEKKLLSLIGGAKSLNKRGCVRSWQSPYRCLSEPFCLQEQLFPGKNLVFQGERLKFTSIEVYYTSMELPSREAGKGWSMQTAPRPSSRGVGRMRSNPGPDGCLWSG